MSDEVQETIPRIRECSHLLPEPGDEVVRGLCDRLEAAVRESERMAAILHDYERRGFYTKDGRRVAAGYPEPDGDPVEDAKRWADENEQLERLVGQLAEQLAKRQWTWNSAERHCRSCQVRHAHARLVVLEHKPDCELRQMLTDAQKFTGEEY